MVRLKSLSPRPGLRCHYTGVLDDFIGQVRAADVWDTVGGYCFIQLLSFSLLIDMMLLIGISVTYKS